MNYVNAYQTTLVDPTSVTPVSPSTPLPVGMANGGSADASYRSASAYTPSDSTSQSASRALAINATVAGNVSVLMANGGTFVFPVAAGLTILPISIVRVNVTGTTATATYTNLV